ncbi:MAG: glutamate mutase L, partial [Chloroflexota bacterium]
DVFRRVHAKKIAGVAELNTWADGNLIPSSNGLGRVIRFFSKIIQEPWKKGVLGIDVGASTTTVAAGFNGDLRLSVNPNLGMGTGLVGVLKNSQIEKITRWLPIDVADGYILDYIQNKIINPATLPATQKDMVIEQALAREVIRLALKDAESKFPRNISRLDVNTLPSFAPILVSGGVLSLAPTVEESMLIILDAVQPNGIQQIILDKNNLAPVLGAASSINPTLVTQLLHDPVAFLNLGTVIAPISRARPETPVIRLRISYETGGENTITVKKGQLLKVPLPLGHRAKLYIDPLTRANVGRGPGKKVTEQVIGGPFGVVIDARGRPLDIPSSAEKRKALLIKWHQAIRN